MEMFRVWAPNAKTVEIEVSGTRHKMQAGDAGWWSAKVSCERGSDYAYILDGGNPLPDPRSPWQPHGVHGFSRTVDHERFEWHDHGFQAPPLPAATIYELHIGTFTKEGTFDAAIERLDHLVDLGITHVELLPVNAYSGTWGWGYDGVDWYAVHEPYGGPEAMKRFVDAAHQRGLAVLLDVVYNHLGPTGNYIGQFGPYFTDRYGTPWGPAVNFDDAGSNEVRRFVCDNAIMWLRDYHIDGLRLDAVHAILDASAVHIFEQLGHEVAQLSAELGRHLVLIAESDLNNPRYMWSRDAGGYGLDAQWSDDFHHALHSVLTGERDGYYEDFGSLEQLAKAMQSAYVFDGCYSPHRRRSHGRSTQGMSGHQFLAYIQNHDQVGNRAKGERIGHLVSEGRAKIAAALVFTSPFVPMVFQGEEWNASTPFQYFSNHPEQHMAEAVRNGRRAEFAAFGWDPQEVPDPQASATYKRSKLKWAEIDKPPHAEMLQWYKSLIQLRATFPMLRDGRMSDVKCEVNDVANWFVMHRGPLCIACNLNTSKQRVPVTFDEPTEVILASTEDVSIKKSGIDLAGESVAICGPTSMRIE